MVAVYIEYVSRVGQRVARILAQCKKQPPLQMICQGEIRTVRNLGFAAHSDQHLVGAMQKAGLLSRLSVNIGGLRDTRYKLAFENPKDQEVLTQSFDALTTVSIAKCINLAKESYLDERLLTDIANDVIVARQFYKANTREKTALAGELIAEDFSHTGKKLTELSSIHLDKAIQGLTKLIEKYDLSSKLEEVHQLRQSLFLAKRCLGYRLAEVTSSVDKIDPMKTAMSRYVADLYIYNGCQVVHAGRLNLQKYLSERLKEHLGNKPGVVFIPGCSNGTFDVAIQENQLSKDTKIICFDNDAKAVEQFRENFKHNSNIVMLDPMGVQEFVKNEAHKYEGKADAVVATGWFTDVASTNEERAPELEKLVKILKEGGILAGDEEMIGPYKDADERHARLWQHHGGVIFESVRQCAHYTALAGGRENVDFKVPIPKLTTKQILQLIEEAERKVVLKKEDYALLARLHYELAAVQELDAFGSGWYLIGDHKTTRKDFEEIELKRANLKVREMKTIWPLPEDLIVKQEMDKLNALVQIAKTKELPGIENEWNKTSIEVMRNIMAVNDDRVRNKSGYTLEHDNGFKNASIAIGEFVERVIKLGDPVKNPKILGKLEIKLTEAGEVNWGVTYFEAVKVAV